MAAVVLPTLPRRVEYNIREINRDRSLEPSFGGGDETLIQRIGTKHEIVVSVPAIASVGCGPALVAALTRGKSLGAVMPIPEPRLDIGLVESTDGPLPGVLVNGANQLGSSLVVDGLLPGAVIPAGKWLSVIISGRRYAYFTTTQVTASGGGAATLPIYPIIRRSPPDNAQVEISAPKIEGRVILSDRDVRRIGALSFSFTIRERG